MRKRIVDEVDGSSSQSQLDDDMDDEAMRTAEVNLRQPSNDAMAKFEDYCECFRAIINFRQLSCPLVIPYISDEHADAATKNPHLKLVFRLVKFYIQDESQ